jgi:phage gpG-like protein
MMDTNELERFFKLVEKNANNKQIIDNTIIPLLKSANAKNFAAHGRTGSGSGLFDGGSGKWVELAESTKKAYARKTKKHKPVSPLTVTLARTGRLKRSIDIFNRNNSIVFRAGGSDVPYAEVHQFGGDSMPSRPIFQLTQSDVNQIVNELSKQLTTYF